MGKKLRILILEDVPTDAELMERELSKAGIEFTFIRVDTRDDFLQQLEDFSPDLVLSDYAMPEFTGMEALEIKNERAPDLPFIVVTTSINEETAADCIKRGADDYITKQHLMGLQHAVKRALEKKRLERVEKQAQKQIKLSAQQWRKTFDAMRDAVALLDADYKILRGNTALCKLIGKPWEQIIGRSCCQLVHGHAESLPACPLQRTIRTLRHETWRTSIGDRWFDLIADPILDEHNRLSGIVHVIMDITERKRMEEDRQKLQEQFLQSQKMESVGRLAGGVAHDFSNMLSVIMGYTELALDEVNPKEPIHADLHEVLKAAKRSTRIVQQLLAFARKQPIEPRVLNLNETVEGMLKMLRRLIGENIELFWLPKSKLLNIYMDTGQIDQLLANLCVNSRDAISGVGRITIETDNVVLDRTYCTDHAGFVPDEHVMLAVSDNGCGMDNEVLDKVFEPFFTTKELGKGTGLGLSTVYGIVKQNQGVINVYSEPGNGTTFKIYLPRYGGKAEVGLKEPADKIPQGHGETILIVEDEASILDVCKRILMKLGYRVLTAGTPGKAMEVVRGYADEIHLLITDVVMPEMNGKELAKQIITIRPNMKTLFMSGYTADAISHHGILDKGVHYIQKPLIIDSLARKIRKALGIEFSKTH